MSTAPSSAPPPPASVAPGPAGPSPSARHDWIDRLKGLALLWIFLNHAAEQIWGGASLGNPYAGWPPLADRLSQWLPLSGYGLLGVPVNLFRYLGWLGDQAVSLFLIASGFGLAWSLAADGRNPGAPRWRDFYARRVWRIYPLWWAAHALLLFKWFCYLLPPGSASSLFLSLVGIRATPSTFEFYSPSWWFIGLLIQLYLVFPLLWKVMKRFGPWKVLAGILIVATVARAVGMIFLSGYMVPWIRGSVFITRLPEFALGMALAETFHRAPQETARRLRSGRSRAASWALYLIGTVLSATWAGMAIAPFVVGAGAVGVLFPFLAPAEGSANRSILGWVGRHSYPLYLVHHSVIGFLVPEGAALAVRVIVRILAAAGVSVLLGVLMEWIVGRAENALSRWKKRAGPGRMAIQIGCLGAALAGALAAAELLSRKYDPMEVQGWGERASLAPDPQLGWKLKASANTRLRWESYDYTVTSNALGFPGPDYPDSRTPGSIRVLATGDAFTSAEGVDTGRAWPRLLEAQLARQRPRQKVEVLNFAVTGYGPQQYAGVIRTYVPVFHPDLVIVEMFVNDFSDAVTPVDTMSDGIGFDLPPADHWKSLIRLVNLRMWLKLRCAGPIVARILRRPEPNGYMLGCFGYLHRGPDRIWTEGADLIRQHLSEIRTICDAHGARLLVIMVPAAAQVCTAGQLAYYPAHVDLTDESRFDLDRPQRILGQIADDLKIRFLDLRPVLRASSECPYQPRNMHWTVAGHTAVAAYLAPYLEAPPGLLPAPRD
ncbi:MAG TPA: acyltransferase family protein [Planctomycetota bacterium]|nr:acyltransferase family protein [Planctomycetota bacterium]